MNSENKKAPNSVCRRKTISNGCPGRTEGGAFFIKGGKLKMKNLFLAALIISSFMAGFIWSQVEPKPYTYKFDKDIGDCLFTGASRDIVWSAALKALMLMKFQVLSAEKQSGTISARKTPSGFQSALGVENMPELDLVFEDRDGGVAILSSIIAGINWPSKNRRDLEKKFYEGVAELLYKSPAKGGNK